MIPLVGQHPERRVPVLERLFVVAALVVATKALVFLAGADESFGSTDHADGSLIYQVLIGAVYATAGMLLLARPAALRAWNVPPGLVLLVLLALLSSLWSANPIVTLRKAGALAGSLVLATYLSHRLSPRELLETCAMTLGILGLLSLLLSIALPSTAVHMERHHIGAWRGAFAHKNNLGEMMTLGALAFVCLALLERRNAMYLCGAALCLTLVWKSESRGAWVASVVAMILTLVLHGWRRGGARKLASALAATVLCLLGGAVLAGSEDAFTLLGRDSSLTGRTGLWEAAIAVGGERPVIGHGYGAFWLGESGAASKMYMYVSSFAIETGHGHSGYLDVWLELGFLGAAALLWLIGTYCRRSALLGEAAPNTWFVALLVYFLLVNFVTTVALDRNSIVWLLFQANLLHLCSHTHDVPTAHAVRAASLSRGLLVRRPSALWNARRNLW